MEESLFYLRLKTIIENKGKSFNQVEKEMGYPRNSLNNYRHKQTPSGRRLIELSEHLEVTPEFLVGKSQNSMFNSVQVVFNKLTRDQKFELWAMLQHWIDKEMSNLI